MYNVGILSSSTFMDGWCKVTGQYFVWRLMLIQQMIFLLTSKFHGIYYYHNDNIFPNKTDSYLKMCKITMWLCKYEVKYKKIFHLWRYLKFDGNSISGAGSRPCYRAASQWRWCLVILHTWSHCLHAIYKTCIVTKDCDNQCKNLLINQHYNTDKWMDN